MAVDFGNIDWDNADLEWLLNSPDGPVGQMLEEMAAKATAVALAKAPVQSPRTWSWTMKGSTSYQPRSEGYLKGTIRPHMGYTKSGQLFSGVNAAYGPTLFLERPAKQMHHIYPFMTEALWSVSI